jgi:hypothetical protein
MVDLLGYFSLEYKNTTRKLINTNGNTEGITVGKKIKQSKKKMMTCHFYQRNYRRNKFRR